jgi:D-sedoheptulose 7-phosphate isomerase
MEAAGTAGMARIALTGANGGPVADLADHVLRAPSTDTPRIQECHILVGHLLCEIAERTLFPGGLTEPTPGLDGIAKHP